MGQRRLTGACREVRRATRLLSIAEVRELSVYAGGAAPDDEVFAHANEWMVDTAHQFGARPYAVIVWDGRTGDRPAGLSTWSAGSATAPLPAAFGVVWRARHA